MKSLNTVLAAGVSLSFVLAAQPMIASAAAEPAPTIQSEQAAHPRIVAAINQMQDALREMEAAPYDFGGNKAVAMNDTRQAIHSLKKALYFRLKMDDAAIDRIK